MSERSFHQISQQYESGHKPSVLIRRSDGTIQAAELTEFANEHGNRLVRFDKPKNQSDNEAQSTSKRKYVNDEALSDYVQSQLANELASDLEHEETIPDLILDSTPELEPEQLSNNERQEDRAEAQVALGVISVREALGLPPKSEVASIEQRSNSQVTSLKEELLAKAQSLKERKELAPPTDSELSAQKLIAKIMLSGNLNGGMLQDDLRKLGDNAAVIQRSLKDREHSAKLRSDVEAALAIRMRQLLDEGGHFHERVQANDPNNLKTPNGNHGYGNKKFTSEEYAVVLAMAKLDGTFDVSRSKDYKDLPDDHAHQGQHRQAADTLLASFMTEDLQDDQHPIESDDGYLIARIKEYAVESAERIDYVRVELQNLSESISLQYLNYDEVSQAAARINSLIDDCYEDIKSLLGSSIEYNDIIYSLENVINTPFIHNLRAIVYQQDEMLMLAMRGFVRNDSDKIATDLYRISGRLRHLDMN